MDLGGFGEDRVWVMSDWQTYRINDIADLYDHQRIPLSSKQRAGRRGSYPYYGASGIIDFIDGYLFDGEYVLVAEDGENLRSRKTPVAFKANGKFWVNNHAHILKGKEHWQNDLIVYLFRNTNVNPYITGAAQPKLNQENLLSIEFELPSKDECKQIVDVLSSLDEKIELNRKQNRTLEAIAQALFKRWFVEFEFPDQNGQPYKSSGGAMQPSELGEIPVGWEVKPLSDLTTYLSRGLTPSYLEEGGVAVLNQKCIRGGWINMGPARRHDSKVRKVEGRKLQPGDILVNSTGVGTLGRVAQVVTLEEPMVVDSHVTVVRVNPEIITPEYLGVLVRLKEREIEYMAEGSTGQTELSRVKLGELPIIVPDDRRVQLFSEIVSALNNKRALNWKESKTLSYIRDTLLPKLMSGELRVA